jgi:CheY-like chemotaxis protein
MNSETQTAQPMKYVLLVDDDPVAVRIYRDGLTRLGFEVTTAVDGLAALNALRTRTPDVVVLDLMMPKLSGVEVLKFIRGQKELEKLPVVVLSNAYMDPMAHNAANLGAQKGLLKLKCNPASLATAINEVLLGSPGSGTVDELLAASSDPQVPKTTPPQAKPAPPPPPEPVPVQTTPALEAANTASKEQARQELAFHAQTQSKDLHELFEAFRHARDIRDRKLRLDGLFRKVHFITALAALAEDSTLAQMSTAFEALLFGMMDKFPNLKPTLERTTGMAIDFLQELLERPLALRPVPEKTARALVVDDDPLSNRLVISALRNAHLQARGTEDPELALSWLKEQTFDLILLDVEMPKLDGIELCKQLRTLRGYERTPVIFVTLHSDYETRAKTVLSGGNDLLAKPILPAELAVKAVMYLLKHRLPNQAAS